MIYKDQEYVGTGIEKKITQWTIVHAYHAIRNEAIAPGKIFCECVPVGMSRTSRVSELGEGNVYIILEVLENNQYLCEQLKRK